MSALPESPDLSETRLQEIRKLVDGCRPEVTRRRERYPEVRDLGYSAALVDLADENARLQSALTAARAEREEANNRLTVAASALENWGTHHAWCPRSWENGGRDVACECGYLDAIKQAHDAASRPLEGQRDAE